MRGIGGQVGHGDAGADDGSLVAHRVHAPQQVDPGRCLPHVELVHAFGRDRGAVRLLEHQVDTHHLVAARVELAADGGADEPGSAGEQDLHGPTVGHGCEELGW